MIEQQNNIKNYLTDKMTDAERQEFEKLIEKEEALAAEVRFNEDLMSFLNDDNPELEAMLTDLGNKFSSKNTSKNISKNAVVLPPVKPIDKTPPKSNSSNNKLWLILIGILIAIAAIWFLSRGSNNNNQENSQGDNSTSSSIESTIEEDTKSEKIENLIKGDDTSPEEESSKEKTAEPEGFEKTPPKIKDIIPEINRGEAPPTRSIGTPKGIQPMASLDKVSYTPNNDLEILIMDGIRSGNLVFELNQPKDFYTFYKKDEQVKIAFDGTMNQDIPLELVIYDNTQWHFNKNISILKTDIRVRPNNDEFRFNFIADTTIEKGLYYFLIYNKETKEMLAISKFSVK